MGSNSISSNQAGPTLHFVVTCMGRLDMIRQTIDLAVAQPNSTYTLVDYSCPQHTGQWVRDRYPQANVVFAEGRTSWHASEAHNLGAETIRDGWICFLDSDVLLKPDFSQTVLSTIKPGTFMIVDSEEPSLFGLLICSQEDFVRAGGYDEIIRDWGGEDLDLRRSLTRVGVEMTSLPESLAGFIPHDDSVRTQNCLIKDRIASNHANTFYCYVKDFMLTAGETLTTEQLRMFYNFGRDRLLKGMPWLSWPDGVIEPGDFPRLFRHIFALSDGYRSMALETWGPVRLFRIQRDGDTMTEMLSIHNSHRISLRAPGRTTLDVVSIYGDTTAVPVQDGECSLVIKAEPIFLPAGVSLIRDVSVMLAPAPGPALSVELTPGPEYDGQPLRLKVSVDGCVVEERDIPALDGKKHLRIPVSPASPEQSTVVEVTLTVGERTQVMTRRMTFLTARPVTHEQAMTAKSPAGVYRYTLSEVHEDDSPRCAEVAWGWTESDLVCWIEREHAPDVETWITVAIDAENIKSTHIEPQQVKVHMDSVTERKDGAVVDPEHGSRVTYHNSFDTTSPLDGSLSTAFSGSSLCMALRIPFDVIGVSPAIGHTIGLSLLIDDIDGEGATRSLAWGGGIGIWHMRNPRLYNEITLED